MGAQNISIAIIKSKFINKKYMAEELEIKPN